MLAHEIDRSKCPFLFKRVCAVYPRTEWGYCNFTLYYPEGAFGHEGTVRLVRFVPPAHDACDCGGREGRRRSPYAGHHDEGGLGCHPVQSGPNLVELTEGVFGPIEKYTDMWSPNEIPCNIQEKKIIMLDTCVSCN
jgi:hypothetical protein